MPQSDNGNQVRITQKIPKFYGVYLLNSLAKKNSYYIGSTPNPYQRLRQHNGELSSGGARRTKKNGSRPWKMNLIVYGFNSNISALQFEHAWQHFYKTRHINNKLSKKTAVGSKSVGFRNLHNNLANLKLLLLSKSFCRLGLKIMIFDKVTYDYWILNKFNVKLSNSIPINFVENSEDNDASGNSGGDSQFINGGNYNQIKKAVDQELENNRNYKDRSMKLLESETELKIECLMCQKKIDQNVGLIGFCYHLHCDNPICHLSCWSKAMVKDLEIEVANSNEKDKDPEMMVVPLIPIKGKCSSCEKINWWSNVVRNSLSIYNELNNTK